MKRMGDCPIMGGIIISLFVLMSCATFLILLPYLLIDKSWWKQVRSLSPIQEGGES